MDVRGYAICTPRGPEPSLATEPFLNLKSGYVLRSVEQLPRQGTRTPWRLNQNYFRDIRLLKRGPVDDEMEFSRLPSGPHAQHARARVGTIAA